MRRKMLLSFIAILLSFCVITFFVVLDTVYQMVRDNVIETVELAMRRWSGELTDTIDFSRNYILNIAINENLQELLRNGPQYAVASDQSSTNLLHQAALKPFLSSNTLSLDTIPFMIEISYRASDGSYIPAYVSEGSNQSLDPARAPDDPWVVALEEKKGGFLYDIYHSGSHDYLRVSKVIYDNQNFDRILGIIAVNFSYEHLAQSILRRLNNEGGINAALYDAENDRFVGYYTVTIPESVDVHTLSHMDGGLLINEEKECLFATRLLRTDFYLVGSRSLEDVRQVYMNTARVLVLTAGLTLLFAAAVVIFVTHSVMRPVVRLSATMKEIKNGDLDISVSTTETDEVGELYDSFNHMIQMINQLIQENYVTRLNQKQSELNALQSQINTHFLYNTLDTINWLAKDYHAEDISKLVMNLSTLLRTSLNNGQQELSVEREIAHVRSYLNIQMIRFEGLFTYREEIDESILNDRVIKMLLQPLVENAILHVFDQPESDENQNLLILRAFRRQEELVLEVSNNAPPQALRQVNERLWEDGADAPKSYGIHSIRTRLGITYAGQAIFEYEMDQGMLTARIQIPRSYTAPNRRALPELNGEIL